MTINWIHDPTFRNAIRAEHALTADGLELIAYQLASEKPATPTSYLNTNPQRSTHGSWRRSSASGLLTYLRKVVDSSGPRVQRATR